VALDVSRAVTAHPRPQTLVLECDFLPTMTANELDAWLRDQAIESGKKQIAVVLAEQLPRRLCEALLAEGGIAAEQKMAELGGKLRERVVEFCKKLTIPISGTCGFKKAEVTAGGVALDEVDSRTMQSKLVEHLFFAGEVLDLDGPIGGYNFQAAWSTGYLAGLNV